MNDQDRRSVSEMNNIVEVRKTGSSLKLCNIAMDEVDAVPGVLREWSNGIVLPVTLYYVSVGGSIYNINDEEIIDLRKE